MTAGATDRAAAERLVDVSRETWNRLELYVELLIRWQRAVNLVAPATLSRTWTRHVADSLQLLPLAKGARRWVDLGAGAGFPGLPVAIALADRPGAEVHLVESDQRKAAFLREAARATAAPVTIHARRAEDMAGDWPDGVEIVTARALAPLPRLLELAHPLLKTGARGIFPKGQDVDAELTEAAKSWIIDHEFTPSVTDPRGRIIMVNGIERRPKADPRDGPHHG